MLVELINYDNQDEVIIYNFFLDGKTTSLTVKKNEYVDYTDYNFALNYIRSELFNENKKEESKPLAKAKKRGRPKGSKNKVSRKKLVKKSSEKKEIVKEEIKKPETKTIFKLNKKRKKDEFTYTQLEAFIHKSIMVHGYEEGNDKIVYYFTFNYNKKKYKSKAYFDRAKNDKDLYVMKDRVCNLIKGVKLGLITNLEDSIKAKLPTEILESIEQLEKLRIDNKILIKEFQSEYLNHFIYSLNVLSKFDFNGLTDRERKIVKSFYISIIDYKRYSSKSIYRLLKDDGIRVLLSRIDAKVEDRMVLLGHLKQDRFLPCYM